MRIRDCQNNKVKFRIEKSGEDNRIICAKTNKCLAIIKANGDVYSPSSGRKIGTNGDYTQAIIDNN
jgi:hypothetical protein